MASLLKELLFENSTQAPSPSKDFHHLAVTKTELIWRWWKISLRAKSRDLRPGEMKLSHQDFLGNIRLQQQIGLVFGSKFLDYTVGLCEGRFDYLERLPDNLLQHIISYLSFQDICRLSETSHHFKKLCDSLELWEEAVRRCSNEITPEIQRLAEKFSWRMIYITFCHNLASESEDSLTPEDMEVPFMSYHRSDRRFTDIGLKLCAVHQAFSLLLASIDNQNYVFMVGKKIVVHLIAANNQVTTE